MLKDHVRLLWGPILAIIVGSIAYGAGMSPIMAKVTTVALWMMIWWLDNFVRMGITGLLPIVLLPLLAVNPGNKVSSIYFSDGMILCIGSLLMASAIESCHLHILAAKLINRYSASRGLTFILFLFVMITGFLSMWISNTATAALMLPIANAFIETLTERQGKAHDRRTKEKIAAVGSALDLSIAFASSIGGMATLIGTGSNIVLMGVMKNVFGEDNHEVSFLGWLVMAGPLSLINLLWLWFLLSAAFIWRWPWLYRFVRSDLDDDADDETGSGDDDNASEPPSPTSNSRSNNHSNSSNISSNPLHHQQSEMDSMGHVNLRHRFSSSDEVAVGHERCPTRSLEDVELEQPSEEATGVNKLQGTSVGVHAAVSDPPAMEDSFRLTYRSKAVIWTFSAMAVLWMTRDPPGKWGWAYALGVNAYVTDGTVAMAACLFLMILPATPISWAELCSTRWWKASRVRAHVSGRLRRHPRAHLLPSHDDEHLHSPHPIDTVYADDDSNYSHPHHHHHHHRDRDNNSSQFHEAKDVEMVAFPSTTDGAPAVLAPSSPSTTTANTATTTAAPETVPVHADADHASPSSSHSKHHHHHYEAVLPWTAVQSLHWDVVFLLGGGFALSLGFEASGLSQWISHLMVQYGPHTLPGFILVASILSCLVTNVMSNVAAANVILPSLVCLGPQYHQSPLAILMPVTLSISLALLFPMGTPPNAIIMTNKRVDSAQLLKTGALLTVCTLASVIVYSIFVLPVVGGFHTVSATVHSVCGTS